MLIYFFFFFLGFVSLIYEILWIRFLFSIVGSELNSITLIISGYILGFAVGYFLSFRLDEKDVKKIIFLNIINAVYCFFSLNIFKLSGIFGSEILLFIFSSILIFLPASIFALTLTYLINNPFSILTSTSTSPSFGLMTSILYGFFNLGCFFGCLISGYFLLYYVGIKNSVYIISIFYFLTSVFLYFSSILKSSVFLSSYTSISHSTSTLTSPFALIFLSGFTSLAYEILWLRFFKTIFGSSNITITIIFAIYIMGLSFGNIFYRYFYQRVKGFISLKGFGIIQIILSIYILLFLFVMPYIPFLLIKLIKIFGEGYVYIQIIYFILSFPFVFIPTFFFGLLFPLFVDSVVCSGMDSRKIISYSFGLNTVGSVLGLIVTNFILIGLFGVKNSFIIIVCINFIIGLIVFIKNFRRIFIIGLAFGLIVIFAANFRWDKRIFSVGFYIYRDFRDRDIKTIMDFIYKGPNKLVYYGEGKHFDVAVLENPKKELFLRIDGKTDASSGKGGDMWTQVLSAHIPMMLCERCNDILLIGLGSGITLGEINEIKSREAKIDVCEIEPKIVEAARYFSKYNRNVTNNKEINFIIKDGRFFLNRTKKRYDLIISVPTNIWVSGSTHIFSHEFFEIVKSKLRPGGIHLQWFQIYDVSLDAIKSILKTFFATYKYGYLFTTDEVMGDLLLIGSDDKIDLNNIVKKFDNHSPYLKRVDIINLPQLIKRYISDRDRILELFKSEMIVSDDKPAVEIDVLKNIYLPSEKRNINTSKNISFFLDISALPSFVKDKGFIKRLNLEILLNEYLNSSRIKSARELMGLYSSEFKEYVRYYARGVFFLEEGNFKEAEKNLKRSIELNAGYILSYLKLLELYMLIQEEKKLRDITKIIEDKALRLKDDRLFFYLYNVYIKLGDPFKALGYIKKSLEMNAKDEYMSEYVRILKICKRMGGDEVNSAIIGR